MQLVDLAAQPLLEGGRIKTPDQFQFEQHSAGQQQRTGSNQVAQPFRFAEYADVQNPQRRGHNGNRGSRRWADQRTFCPNARFRRQQAFRTHCPLRVAQRLKTGIVVIDPIGDHADLLCR